MQNIKKEISELKQRYKYQKSMKNY